jgi:hypothetical protein
LKLKIDFDIPSEEIGKVWPSFFTMGSCFAQNQAIRKRELGFNAHSNPFGILYNPISIEHIFDRCQNSRLYTKEDFENKGSYFSWEHHGDFNYDTADKAVAESNVILQETQKALSQADVIILTYGTSLVYRYKDKVIANCHKQPNNIFEHEQLSFSEIKASIHRTLDLISSINAEAKVIFTVSPIRHLRSGVTESSRSKAVLLAALHEALGERKNKQSTYFPSYEIFMDELRDYRFVKEDLTHPTIQAEQYIWERFSSTFFNKKTTEIIDQVMKYNDFKNHRPKNTSLHLQQLIEKKNKLNQVYPFINIT